MASSNIEDWLPKLARFGSFALQPKNLNAASQTNFRFILDKIPTITYFCTSANGTPAMTSTPQELPTMFAVNPKFPGGRAQSEITVRFIISEDFENYMQLIKWMRSGVPYRDFKEVVPEYKSIPSDGRLFLLNNKKNPVKMLTFRNLIPVQIGGFTLTHNETESSVLTTTVNFVFDKFDLTALDSVNSPVGVY